MNSHPVFLSQLKRPSVNSHPVLSRLRRLPMSSRLVLSWLGRPSMNSRPVLLWLKPPVIFRLALGRPMGPSWNLLLILNYLSCPLLSICLIMNCPVCPISPKESNVEPAPNNVCPAPNKKPVICPISLVVSPKTVNSLHIYPVNPVTDNITTLNRINTELSALTVTAQKPAFAHFTPPVLSPETIYANFVTNPVCGLPPDSHQRSPFHRIDSCTTLLLHVTHDYNSHHPLHWRYTQLIALITCSHLRTIT